MSSRHRRVIESQVAVLRPTNDDGQIRRQQQWVTVVVFKSKHESRVAGTKASLMKSNVQDSCRESESCYGIGVSVISWIIKAAWLKKYKESFRVSLGSMESHTDS